MEGWGGGDRLEAGGEPSRTPWLVCSQRREFWVSSLVKGSVRILPKREGAGDLWVEGLSESRWDQQGGFVQHVVESDLGVVGVCAV